MLPAPPCHQQCAGGGAGGGGRNHVIDLRVSLGVRETFWNCVGLVVYNTVDMLKATKVITLKALILCDFTSIN